MPYPHDNTPAPTCQGAEFAAEIIRHDQTLERMSTRKAQARELAAILDMAGYHTAAAHVYCCGDSVILRQYEDGTQEVAGAMYCRERLCPVCQWRRSLKLYGQLSQCMDALDEQRVRAAKKPYRYLLLTVTVENCADDQLDEILDKMQDGFRALTRCPEYKASVQGAYRSTEVKRSKRREAEYRWHPHIHALLCVQPSYFASKTYISQAEWRRLWQLHCKLPYEPSVDIRALPEVGGDERNRQKGIAEATKYVCKSDWYTLSDGDAVRDITTLMSSLRGRKLVGWYGNLRQMHRQLHLDDEDGNLVDIAPIRADVAYTLAHYIWRNGSYIQIPMRASDGGASDLLSLHMALSRTDSGHYVPESDDWALLHDVQKQLAPPDYDAVAYIENHYTPFGGEVTADQLREEAKAHELPKI